MRNLKRNLALVIVLSLAIPVIVVPSFIREVRAQTTFGPINVGLTGSEDAIAVNPTNPSNAVIRNVFTASQNQMAMYTKDGGATWHAGNTTTPPQGNNDPDITVDSSGNFYETDYPSFPGGGNWSMFNYKSVDGGVTWSQLPPVFSQASVVALPGGGTAHICKNVAGIPILFDFPKIVADRSTTSPFKNNLYFISRVDLNSTSTACQNLSSFIETTFRSTDGGMTWIDGQAFSLSQFNGYQGAKMIGVTADGTVLITSSAGNVIVTRSVDGGHTYSSSTIYTNPSTPSQSNPSLFSGEVAAGYGTNAVITSEGCVAVCNNTQVYHLFALSSSNDGATWSSTPVRVDDVLNPDNTQITLVGRPPWPAASMSSATGRVDVVWYDHRNGNTTWGDIYTSYSNNNGASFAANIRISPQTGCMGVASCAPCCNDFLGIDSSAHSSYIAYDFSTTWFARIDFPGFDMSANPSLLNIQQFGSASVVIGLTSVHGFAGPVTLSASAPSGVSTSFSSSSVNLSPGGGNSSTLTVNVGFAVPIGNYTITVTGSGGSTVNSVTLVLQVSNFTESISPTSVYIPILGSGSVTITEISENGYAGSVTPFISGGMPSCVTYSFSPATVQLSSHGTASSTLTMNPGSGCRASSNGVSVQSNSGTTGVATGFNLFITDFNVSANPLSLSIRHGTSGSSTITLTSLSGFSGTVILSWSISPSVTHGPSPSLSPTTVTLSSGGQGTSTLTVSTANNTPKQSYTITVTAKSGSITHTVSVSVTVT